MAERLLRPAQVAEALGVSPSTALRLMGGHAEGQPERIPNIQQAEVCGTGK